MKTKIDKTQQNIRYRLCDNGDETINYLITECTELVQKDYKASHEWESTGNCAIHPGEWVAQNTQGFWDTNRSLNLGQATRPSDSNKKREKN